MSLIILNSLLLACIRIAILTQMRTGVVLANVLAYHTATELALAFVALRMGEEVHQGFVVVGEANHQVIVHAAVVLDAVWLEGNLLATSGQLIMPFLVQFRKPFGKFLHLQHPPFLVVHMAFLKVGFHLFI